MNKAQVLKALSLLIVAASGCGGGGDSSSSPPDPLKGGTYYVTLADQSGEPDALTLAGVGTIDDTGSFNNGIDARDQNDNVYFVVGSHDARNNFFDFQVRGSDRVSVLFSVSAPVSSISDVGGSLAAAKCLRSSRVNEPVLI